MEPPHTTDERTMLEAWLEWHRATLLQKCAGLTGEQLATKCLPPSSMSLLGLVRHVAGVERGWFRGGWQPEVPLLWDWSQGDVEFDQVDPDRADEDRSLYVNEVQLARTEAARHELDDVVRAPWRSHDASLRWIYLHMIEEYARHNGHADILREQIDGRTGA